MIVLGVLFGVGLCFWIPMMLTSDGGRRARSGSDAKPKATAQTRGSDGSTPDKATSGGSAGKSGMPSDWRGLYDLLLAHGVMSDKASSSSPQRQQTPLSMALVSSRNPFLAKLRAGGRASVGRPQPVSDSSQGQRFDLNAESPVGVGLALGSTMVGTGFRGVIISGDVYVVGDRVPRVPADQIPEGVELFELTDIQTRQVLLRRQGRTYALSMKSGRSTGRRAADAPEQGKRRRGVSP